MRATKKEEEKCRRSEEQSDAWIFSLFRPRNAEISRVFVISRSGDVTEATATNGIRILGLFSDPFADAVGNANEDVQDGLVHIRIQQRNGRKTLTTVQGLSSNYDLKKIVRTCKKVSIALSHSMTLGVTVRCCCCVLILGIRL